MNDQPMAVTVPVIETGKNSGKERKKRRPRGEVRVFGKWCKGCGLCVAFCPEQVFETNGDGKAVVAHPEKCVACMWCYHHCPDFAINVRRLSEDERETTRHAD